MLRQNYKYLIIHLDQAITLLAHIWYVAGSNPSQDIDYPEVLHGSSQFLQANPKTAPIIGSQLRPSTFFLIITHSSL
jgi:hypothetical protein